jgi:hypothetical protein
MRVGEGTLKQSEVSFLTSNTAKIVHPVCPSCTFAGPWVVAEFEIVKNQAVENKFWPEKYYYLSGSRTPEGK